MTNGQSSSLCPSRHAQLLQRNFYLWITFRFVARTVEDGGGVVANVLCGRIALVVVFEGGGGGGGGVQ